MEHWLGNSRTLDFSEVAHKLGATWAKKMFAAFRLRTRRIPGQWPGTKPQARRLASAYFISREDSDRLANEVQKIAVRTWIALVYMDARPDAVGPPHTAAIAP
jgi:hypothetical protein